MTLGDITSLLRLSTPGQTVLVVEDQIPHLLRLTDYLEEAGHHVVAMAGVQDITGSIASGLGPDLDTAVSVDMTIIDAAFLDYYFLSRNFNGASLAKALMLAGNPRILGMSSDGAANESMRKAGALAAIRKAELIRLLAK